MDAVFTLAYDPQAPLDYLCGFSDSNWGGLESPKSTSGGVLQIAGVTLATWAKTQTTVALSSCEAELIALNYAAAEGKLALNLIHELDLLPVQKLRVYTDSSSAMKMTFKRGCGRMRHLAVRQLWLQDETHAGTLEIVKVDGKVNVADIMTKHLLPSEFQMKAEWLGMNLGIKQKSNFVGVLSANPTRQELEPYEAILQYDPPQCDRCFLQMKLENTLAGQLFWKCVRCESEMSWSRYRRRVPPTQSLHVQVGLLPPTVEQILQIQQVIQMMNLPIEIATHLDTQQKAQRFLEVMRMLFAWMTSNMIISSVEQNQFGFRMKNRRAWQSCSYLN